VKLVIASHYALPHLGGIEVAIDAIARRLAARGHEVVHIASAATTGHGAADGAPYRVLRLPALNALEDRLGVPWPVFGPQLLPALRRELARADVVHAHGLLYGSSVLALLLARGRRRVLTEHVGHVHYASPALDRIQRAAIGSVGRTAVRRAQAVIVLNDKVGAEIAALGARRIETIPNGVDTDVYRPPEPGERERLRAELGWDDRPRALFVGRLVAKKGIEQALAAAAGASWELVVVGPGRPPAGADHAELLGPLPRGRVAQLYRAADALLLPSRGEGFPLTAQEAMASGLPVVLGDDPAYAPYLGGAGRGARTAPPDPAAIEQAVRAAFGGGADAVAHARRAFSWERAADAHEALYASL
jgi:D-inositol-3-phosphate glycosyltransferase